MSQIPLLNNFVLDPYILKNRVIMAPLTRRRISENGVPNELNAIYYKQRSTAGFIIAEATQISPTAKGYMNTPGIYSDEQTEGWKKITKAVHEEDGLIFLQLWHVGRYSHPLLLPENCYPVAPSAIKIEGKINTPQGYKDHVIPKELKVSEIKQIVNDFKTASVNALKAGFDGIEIHGANGYLIDQFIQDGSNIRTDEYGGTIENRSRFLFEILNEVINVWGSNRVGLRLSPSGIKSSMSDSSPIEHFTYIINRLNDYDLSYLHLLEPMIAVDHLPNYLKKVAPFFRKIYKSTLIANGGYDYKSANHDIENNIADLISFGKLFISNPDLPERFEKQAELTPWNTETFYEGNEKGYTDYPLLSN